jgi:ribose transport system ATP-binding protein
MTSAVTDPVRDAPVLAVHGVTKSFGGAQALRGVDFTLQRGEVHALLGENGAGKTTLMNILSGAIAPDDGDLSINGETVHFDDPREAQAAGIATIHQELDLVPTLDVAPICSSDTSAPAMDFWTRRRCAMRRASDFP